ncbi:MAG: hypothetical protein SGCHY_004300 [Lobulomycetales sp.]
MMSLRDNWLGVAAQAQWPATKPLAKRMKASTRMHMLRKKKSSMHLRPALRPADKEPTYNTVNSTWEEVLAGAPRPSDRDIIPVIENPGRSKIDQVLYLKVLSYNKLQIDATRKCLACGTRETVKHVFFDCMSTRMVLLRMQTAIAGALNLKKRPSIQFKDLIYFFPALRESIRMTEHQLYKLSVIHSSALNAIWSSRNMKHYPVSFASHAFNLRLQARITIDISKVEDDRKDDGPHDTQSVTSNSTQLTATPEDLRDDASTLAKIHAGESQEKPKVDTNALLEVDLPSLVSPTSTISSADSKISFDLSSSIFSTSSSSKPKMSSIAGLVCTSKPRACKMKLKDFKTKDNQWKDISSDFIKLEGGLAHFLFWDGV